MLDSSSDEILCPICSGRKVNLIKTQKVFDINFSVFQCNNKKCQHGFLSPLPSPEVLTSLYSNDKGNKECGRTDEYEECRTGGWSEKQADVDNGFLGCAVGAAYRRPSGTGGPPVGRACCGACW